jgi:hypothetical protein
VARLKPLAGQEQFGLILTAWLTLAALILLTFSVVSGSGTRVVAPVLLVVVTLTVARRHLGRLFVWRSLLAFTILVILLIPIRRYTLPASLPFNLELYRIVVAFVAVGWLASLLADPRVQLRRTGLEGPVFAYATFVLASLIANPDRTSIVAPVVNKQLTFLASYLVLFFLIVSVTSRQTDIDLLTKVLVGGGAAVAVVAVVQSRTGFNPFDHLSKVVPFLRLGSIPTQGNIEAFQRGGHLRAYASAQHPIALGAALVMLLPLAVYLAERFRQRRWLVAGGLLLLGLFATVSRTGALMLIAIALGFVLLRPKSLKRMLVALVPALIVIHLIVPGTLGSIGGAFFPKGGLIAQQENANVGSGRLATLGPVLSAEFVGNPILGEGYSTRVVSQDGDVAPNAPILDDQWAGILVETGILGALAMLWLFVRVIRSWGREAKAEATPERMFLAAALLSVTSYGVGMFTFDSFAFIQVTFLFFILLGLGSSALALTLRTASARDQRSRAARPHPASYGQA